MSKITLEQVKEMFQMQDEMNKKVHPEWKKQDYDWHLAAHMELMEGVDHYGWKWWKHQEPDLPQVQLEVVDAWHFWMSAYLVQQEEVASSEYGEEYTYDVMCDEVLRILNEDVNFEKLNLKAVYTRISRDYDEDLPWASLLASVELTPQDLYVMYIQKNVLNHFRQDNGYKAGSYVKEWFGEEDNVWLLRASHKLIEEGIFTKKNLYRYLAFIYDEVLSGSLSEETRSKFMEEAV